MNNRRLPLPLEEVNKIGRSHYLTRTQIRNAIMAKHPALIEEHVMTRKFNSTTGEIEKTYAWSSIIEILNKDGLSEKIIANLID
jgi:hypothetical protein